MEYQGPRRTNRISCDSDKEYQEITLLRTYETKKILKIKMQNSSSSENNGKRSTNKSVEETGKYMPISGIETKIFENGKIKLRTRQKL